MSAAIPAVCAAAAIAIASAFFGVVIARAVWADEATHAATLKAIWARTQASLELSLQLKEESNAQLRRTIEIQRKQLDDRKCSKM